MWLCTRHCPLCSPLTFCAQHRSEGCWCRCLLEMRAACRADRAGGRDVYRHTFNMHIGRRALRHGAQSGELNPGTIIDGDAQRMRQGGARASPCCLPPTCRSLLSLRSAPPCSLPPGCPAGPTLVAHHPWSPGPCFSADIQRPHGACSPLPCLVLCV